MKRIAGIVFILGLVGFTGFTGFTGCTSYTTPSDQLVITAHAQNARAFANVANADPDVKPAVKKWLAAEADTWTSFEAWSQGKRPLATQPAQ